MFSVLFLQSVQTKIMMYVVGFIVSLKYLTSDICSQFVRFFTKSAYLVIMPLGIRSERLKLFFSQLNWKNTSKIEKILRRFY